jgi:gas vesicle protein
MAHDNHDEEAIRDEQTISTLAWFITGAIVGVTAAILYAPQSGKETRRYISDKAQAGREAVENASQDIADASRDMFERGRKLVEDAADLFERGRKLVKG